MIGLEVAGRETGSPTPPDSMPTAPLLSYHGRKWRMSDDIIATFPAHRVYVEPFGGGASVLLRKPRAAVDVYNDLDQEVSTLFRVLRDFAQTEALVRSIVFTPYRRDEFAAAYEPTDDPIERARRCLVRSYMSFGTDGAPGAPGGFRADTADALPARVWAGLPERIAQVASRFAGVIVENRSAIHVIRDHDSPDTLFYPDPPYLTSVRAKQAACKGYRHELTEEEHVALLDLLTTLQARVVLSGYPSELYDEKLEGWRKVEMRAVAHRGVARTEVLWLSPNVREKQGRLL